MAKIEEIGWVRSKFKESADPYEMRKHESSVEIKEELKDGLYGIEENSYIQIIFHFHQSSGYNLIGPRYHGDEKGVFACRTPRRPGAVGLTTVKLLERKDNLLRVKGLDALDGTPVLDIKPYSPGLDTPGDEEEDEADREFLKNRPRSRILPLIRNNDLEELLLRAGEFHGHYCVGVALGVMAGTFALRTLAETEGIPLYALQGTGGKEYLSARVRGINCFVDGIQYVTGCTWGNKRLTLQAEGEGYEDQQQDQRQDQQQDQRQDQQQGQEKPSENQSRSPAMGVTLFWSGQSSTDDPSKDSITSSSATSPSIASSSLPSPSKFPWEEQERKVIRVSLNRDLPAILDEIDPEFTKLWKAIRKSGDQTEGNPKTLSENSEENSGENREKYRKASLEMSFRILQTPPEKLFYKELFSQKLFSAEDPSEDLHIGADSSEAISSEKGSTDGSSTDGSSTDGSSTEELHSEESNKSRES